MRMAKQIFIMYITKATACLEISILNLILKSKFGIFKWKDIFTILPFDKFIRKLCNTVVKIFLFGSYVLTLN